ncbi:hypothetical protein ACO0SA_001589 [Hanseniaspora valbyensis]
MSIQKDNIIWPTESDFVQRKDTFFYKNNKIPFVLGKLVKYGRISSITMCLIYYITYSYIIPNLEIISKQRKMFNLKVLLQTRQVLHNFVEKLKLIEKRKTDSHARIIVQLNHINTQINKIKINKKNRITDSANDLGSLITELSDHVAQETEIQRIPKDVFKENLSKKTDAFNKTIRELKLVL